MDEIVARVAVVFRDTGQECRGAALWPPFLPFPVLLSPHPLFLVARGGFRLGLPHQQTPNLSPIRIDGPHTLFMQCGGHPWQLRVLACRTGI